MISVSVIIPIYKVEQHIERCLRSVMRQDYHGPVECILVDDCGEDESVAIAERLLSEYTGSIKFKWIHHSQNKGLSAARNSGLQQAQGEYVFYLDSDDEIITHALTILTDLAMKYPNVDIVYGDWYVAKKYNSLQNKNNLPEYVGQHREVERLLLCYRLAVTGQNKLLRKDYLITNRLFFLEGVYHEDEHMNYFLAKTAQSIAITYSPTYIYYLNPYGITGQFSDRNVLGLTGVVDDILLKSADAMKKLDLLYCFNLLFIAYCQCENKILRKEVHKKIVQLIKGNIRLTTLFTTLYMLSWSVLPHTICKKLSFLYRGVHHVFRRI